VLVALAATGLRTDETNWPLVIGAYAGAFGAAAIFAATPWERLPQSALIIPPIACLLLIGLLRQAQGGATSGYASLAFLPVVWVGLQLSRRAVVAMAVCTSLLLAIPMLFIGAPLYPGTGWRGATLLTLASLVVALAADRVVTDQRRQTKIAQARTVELDRLVATQTAIATGQFDLDAVLRRVAEEALNLSGGEGAVVEVPESGDMVYIAAAGVAESHIGLRLRREGTLSGMCLASGDVLICEDSETDDRVDREACRAVGARSMVVVPLLHDGRRTGVLKVYSSTPNAFPDSVARLLAMLANMIGTALVRADLMRELENQAVTDELTGLANRRAWYQLLDVAIARAGRSGEPLSVVVLDLDGFKQVNDHEGHAAGDNLLIDFARRWSSVLRAGDVLGRIGGDEFAVIVEGADEVNANEVVARLAESLEDGYHASAGIAVWDRLETAAALVRRADSAMYEMKHGRSASR
jgi:diguanylate cyclase (GGDEF)-like protein